MAVTIDGTRKAVNICWDADALEGDSVDLEASNADDVSIRTGLVNDGYAVVTYAADYHGESHIEIRDEAGNVEEGDIEV